MSSPSGSVGGRGLRAAMYRSNSKWYFVAWLVVPQIVHGPPAPVLRVALRSAPAKRRPKTPSTRHHSNLITTSYFPS